MCERFPLGVKMHYILIRVAQAVITCSHTDQRFCAVELKIRRSAQTACAFIAVSCDNSDSFAQSVNYVIMGFAESLLCIGCSCAFYLVVFLSLHGGFTIRFIKD